MDQTSTFSIQEAEAPDMRACRMLLPRTFTQTSAPRALIALDNAGTLIGAAALRWIADGDPVGFPIDVHVIPPARRRGVGHALLTAAATLAAHDAPALRPWSILPENGPEAAFCRATGFIPHHRVLHFMGDAPRMEAMLASYREKLDRAGWIPAGARVVTLADAPLVEVATLVAREFHNQLETTIARLEGKENSTLVPDLCVVLMLDGAVAGTQLLGLGRDGLPEVEVNVVVPALRRGWANLMLTHEGTRNSVRHGVGPFHFFCDERVIDTVKLARRSGAEQTGEDLALWRPLR